MVISVKKYQRTLKHCTVVRNATQNKTKQIQKNKQNKHIGI